jgi:hypothetical protein
VHRAGIVGGRQPLHHLTADPDRLRDGQRAFPGESGLEGLSLVQCHREVEVALLALSDLVHAAQVRVIQRGYRPGLPKKSRLSRSIEPFGRQRELECDRTPEPNVLG